jgi:mono/diheme cytochrome c family protein
MRPLASRALSLLLAMVPGRAVEPPPVLSATGLYAGPATGALAPGLLAYAPQYPLWSDGARKARWLHLPPGARIDARDPRSWRFPVGTRLWKQFAIGGRKVETRLIWRAAADRWVFASYHWREDQTEADLVPASGLAGVAELGGGRRHDIPSRSDCLACHGNGATPVLGFSALQLSPDRDPLAPHREDPSGTMADLRTLEARRLLDPPRPEDLASPPRIRAVTPRGRAALGYLAANCGTCHTPERPIPGVGLLLAHGASPEPALATAVDRPGHYRIPGLPPGTTRIIRPGRPGESSLLQRMETTFPAGRMPPLGSVVPDREAIALVRAWIAEDLAEAAP